MSSFSESILFSKLMAHFSLNRWFSQCIVQQSGQELVKGLTTCLHSQCLVEVGGLESISMEIAVSVPLPSPPGGYIWQ